MLSKLLPQAVAEAEPVVSREDDARERLIAILDNINAVQEEEEAAAEERFWAAQAADVLAEESPAELSDAPAAAPTPPTPTQTSPQPPLPPRSPDNMPPANYLKSGQPQPWRVIEGGSLFPPKDWSNRNY